MFFGEKTKNCDIQFVGFLVIANRIKTANPLQVRFFGAKHFVRNDICSKGARFTHPRACTIQVVTAVIDPIAL